MRKLFILCFLSLLFFGVNGQDDGFVSKRSSMVRHQVRGRGITHKPTIRAMNAVKRHEFVPAQYRNLAYNDRPLPIGSGQTISQPYIVAYMTELMRPTSDMKALEIGAGSGYQAAVLAEIVDSVYTIEIVPELGRSAKANLKRMGYDNVSTKVADGYYGWEEKGPFDIIMVTAAAEHIPPPLIEQLKDGGRMIIPVGSPFMVQQLMLVEKINGKISTRSLIPVRFVPFTRANN